MPTPNGMDVPSIKALIKNVYAAATQMQTAGDIPAGEAVQVARLILDKLFEREALDIPKV